MATHKVIQDIEAEDKFVGPLTLKQFIFAMGGTFFGYLCVFFATKGLAWMLVILAPPMLLGFFMAVPWSKNQPTEVWVLAFLRFRLKPKKRIWDQSGLQELVTITAPKKIEKILTKDFSQTEVKSRLKALADTIDSRGWAVKNASYQYGAGENASDRLISPAAAPAITPAIDGGDVPDVMDEQAATGKFDQMIEDKSREHKASLMDKMERARSGMPVDSTSENSSNVAPPNQNIPEVQPATDSTDEQTLLAELREKKARASLSQSNMHRIGTHEPASTQPPQTSSTPAAQKTSDQPSRSQTKTAKNNADAKAQAAMTTSVRPDILDLSRNNDLNVATIARQANLPDGDEEVVISLH